MKKARLLEILDRLQKEMVTHQYHPNSAHAWLVYYLNWYVNVPFFIGQNNDFDVPYYQFCGFCANRGAGNLDAHLDHLDVDDSFRRAFDSWRYDYVNTETSINGDDVLDIPAADLVVLDSVAYSVDELLLCWEQYPQASWCRSPETNAVYSKVALDVMAQCPRLEGYSEVLHTFYGDSSYSNRDVLGALYDLLCVYYEQGAKPGCKYLSYSPAALEKCAQAKIDFCLYLNTLDPAERELFFDAIVLLNFGDGQQVITTIRDVFEEKGFYCIMIEQTRLWMFLLNNHPKVGGCPWELEGSNEARGIVLPEGASWTRKTVNQERHERRSTALSLHRRPDDRRSRFVRQQRQQRDQEERRLLGQAAGLFQMEREDTPVPTVAPLVTPSL